MDLILHYIYLIITGICTGLFSGVLGVGGGFLMTPIQYWLYTAEGMDGTLATRLAFGTSIAVILPTMIGGAMAHHSRGTVNWRAAIQMGITASAGGFAGGALASHLPGHVPRTIFALLIIITSIAMVWHIKGRKTCMFQGSAHTYLPLGFGVGCIAGISGIGGGVLLVPVLVILFGYPILLAVGTSAATLIFSSIGAVMAYVISGLGVADLPPFSIGYINIISFSLLALTTIPFARIGVQYAHRCSARILQCFFALLLLSLGVLMLVNR